MKCESRLTSWLCLDLASKDEVIAAYDKYEKYVREVLLPAGKLSEPDEAEGECGMVTCIRVKLTRY